MSRHLPVRPELDALVAEADALLDAARAGDPAALTTVVAHGREGAAAVPSREEARELVARAYGVGSWARLETACAVVGAIWRDDGDALRRMVQAEPNLLHEPARAVSDNWGPPMSYAANLGRDRLVRMLFQLGARDLDHAFDRACLQGRTSTARLLRDLGARVRPGAVMGPAETQSGAGMELLLELGATVADEHGSALAPVAMVLETYCRHPEGKHRCLELFAAHGVDLPDTPPMAVHRGRVDLLEAHLSRDPDLPNRTFAHRDFYPPELGCHADETLALHGTPLAGGTLLHLCVDNDEVEIARWLISRGADVNRRAEVDGEGFGGHTALFGCVVSQPFRVGLRADEGMACILLDAGADPNVRASLKKRLRFVEDEAWHEYRNVTPLSWGERFHDPSWVNPAAMALIESRGGVV